MTLRINKIQNQLKNMKLTDYLLQKKKIANMQQALQVALASS